MNFFLVVAISVDSQFTHLAWINTPREQGGLGKIQIPLLSDLTHQISKDYGVYFTRCWSCIERIIYY